MRPDEKRYVVGWTRHQADSPQQGYEFAYHKTVSHRLLVRDVLLSGLRGALLVDEDGAPLASSSTADPCTKYSPLCPVDGLCAFA